MSCFLGKFNTFDLFLLKDRRALHSSSGMYQPVVTSLFFGFGPATICDLHTHIWWHTWSYICSASCACTLYIHITQVIDSKKPLMWLENYHLGAQRVKDLNPLFCYILPPQDIKEVKIPN